MEIDGSKIRVSSSSKHESFCTSVRNHHESFCTTSIPTQSDWTPGCPAPFTTTHALVLLLPSPFHHGELLERVRVTSSHDKEAHHETRLSLTLSSIVWSEPYRMSDYSWSRQLATSPQFSLCSSLYFLSQVCGNMTPKTYPSSNFVIITYFHTLGGQDSQDKFHFSTTPLLSMSHAHYNLGSDLLIFCSMIQKFCLCFANHPRAATYSSSSSLNTTVGCRH
jgi:hypothetical protein